MLSELTNWFELTDPWRKSLPVDVTLSSLFSSLPTEKNKMVATILVQKLVLPSVRPYNRMIALGSPSTMVMVKTVGWILTPLLSPTDNIQVFSRSSDKKTATTFYEDCRGGRLRITEVQSMVGSMALPNSASLQVYGISDTTRLGIINHQMGNVTELIFDIGYYNDILCHVEHVSYPNSISCRVLNQSARDFSFFMEQSRLAFLYGRVFIDNPVVRYEPPPDVSDATVDRWLFHASTGSEPQTFTVISIFDDNAANNTNNTNNRPNNEPPWRVIPVQMH